MFRAREWLSIVYDGPHRMDGKPRPIHSNAHSTHFSWRELQEAPPGVSHPELDRRYGLTGMTVRK